jgi:hypothetical protein
MLPPEGKGTHRPAAAAVELGRGRVQRLLAPGAREEALLRVELRTANRRPHSSTRADGNTPGNSPHRVASHTYSDEKVTANS